MNRPPFTSVNPITLESWVSKLNARHQRRQVLITVSGYEDRAIHWISKVTELGVSVGQLDHLVIGFQEYKDAYSRRKNDDFYGKLGLTITECSADSVETFKELVTTRIQKVLEDCSEDSIEVHVDYSCMPRSWYCSLPVFFSKLARPCDILCYWYSVGKYSETEYPTAGVDDFRIFSGQPSLSPPRRTHIFGLGFDRIRSHAIWSVIDPQYLICFYADSGFEPSYLEKVRSDNKDILAASEYQFVLPLDDFGLSYSKLLQITKQFAELGDVVLVPDGPKPLILASSLIPYSLSTVSQRYGISCFHVTRRKSPEVISEVRAHGEIFGFTFSNPVDF